MRRRVLVYTFLLAVLVYGVLLTYVFAVSPAMKEKYVESWVQKELAKKPKYKEMVVCRECHFEIYAELIGGKHSSVECEDCHGVGYEHAKLRTASSIIIDESRDACLVCHLSIPGRNAVTTVGEDHHPGVKCVVCHEPHDPRGAG